MVVFIRDDAKDIKTTLTCVSKDAKGSFVVIERRPTLHKLTDREKATQEEATIGFVFISLR